MVVRWFELVLGFIVWTRVLWDGFATVVLPRTVAPMTRLSGRFNQFSWWLWAVVGRRIPNPKLRLSYLAIYGPISIVLLLILWIALLIFAFALMFDGSGARFQSNTGPVDFSTLLYLSGSTFLTLGLGDVTTPDTVGRFYLILEVSTGYIFLGLMITYMPTLHQAYGSREVGNLLVNSRVGYPPNAVRFLKLYTSADRHEILRGNLREAERWIADIQQSHLSHPILSFYRAHHLGESWLTSLATILDSCALLIVGGDGLCATQATLTYRLGTRLLEDLTEALGLSVNSRCQGRLSEADLPSLVASVNAAGLNFTLTPDASSELLLIVRKYDVYLVTLGTWLVIPLPSWTPQSRVEPETSVRCKSERDVNRLLGR